MQKFLSNYFLMILLIIFPICKRLYIQEKENRYILYIIIYVYFHIKNLFTGILLFYHVIYIFIYSRN